MAADGRGAGTRLARLRPRRRRGWCHAHLLQPGGAGRSESATAFTEVSADAARATAWCGTCKRPLPGARARRLCVRAVDRAGRLAGRIRALCCRLQRRTHTACAAGDAAAARHANHDTRECYRRRRGARGGAWRGDDDGTSGHTRRPFACALRQPRDACRGRWECAVDVSCDRW